MRRFVVSCMVASCIAAFLGNSFLQAQVTKAPEVPDNLAPQISILEPGVQLTLLAEHPSLVTPTGIDVDAAGRIWLVSSHTHFRPDQYAGPKYDEILTFASTGGDRRVFYNRTEATMHIKHGPNDWLYVAERDRILRVKDTDGDGIGDIEENVITLATDETYPHNGLSGLAWMPDGDLLFSLGENYSKTWQMIGSDGTRHTGRGEGGIFCCSATGTKLRRIAYGFWNPFGLLVRDNGEMFAVENDPGSRPPCRLLHIVDGGDYGYQRAYGNAAIHPFVAWNGELRGTLGMVHPTGEGPCALAEFGGGVLVPSWSNHCIDYFPLVRQGASYSAKRVELLRGSDHFRPVGIAPGLKGEFYLTDWVFSSYPVHRRGRLWRLDIDPQVAKWKAQSWEPENDAARLASDLRLGKTQLSQPRLFELARGNDAFLADAALTELARRSRDWTPQTVRALPPSERVWALIVLRRVNLSERRWVSEFLFDADPEIRFECLRWIADGLLTDFAGDVEKILAEPNINFRLFEAALAAWNTLRGEPEAGVTEAAMLFARVTDANTSALVKAYLLRLLPPGDKRITISLLGDLLRIDNVSLSNEVVRHLTLHGSSDAMDLLAQIASSKRNTESLRADAIAGLSNTSSKKHLELLIEIATQPNRSLQHEAMRALRLHPLEDADRRRLQSVEQQDAELAQAFQALAKSSDKSLGRPPLHDTQAWLNAIDALPGQARKDVGRRIFFNTRLAQCANCHRYHGRGNVVGPDLSMISKQSDRLGLLRSMLEPNRDVAPQFYSTLLELEDGTVFSGILLRSSSTEVFRDAQGNERVFQKDQIVHRKELTTSLMPTGLTDQITLPELRDLLAFLADTEIP